MERTAKEYSTADDFKRDVEGLDCEKKAEFLLLSVKQLVSIFNGMPDALVPKLHALVENSENKWRRIKQLLRLTVQYITTDDRVNQLFAERAITLVIEELLKFDKIQCDGIIEECGCRFTFELVRLLNSLMCHKHAIIHANRRRDLMWLCIANSFGKFIRLVLFAFKDMKSSDSVWGKMDPVRRALVKQINEKVAAKMMSVLGAHISIFLKSLLVEEKVHIEKFVQLPSILPNVFSFFEIVVELQKFHGDLEYLKHLLDGLNLIHLVMPHAKVSRKSRRKLRGIMKKVVSIDVLVYQQNICNP